MKDERNPFITLEEARARGLRYSEPEPVACTYCGRATVPLGIEYGGEVRWITHEPCGCPEELEAKRKEEEREAKEAESKLQSKFLKAGVARRFLGARVDLEASARYLSSFGGNRGAGLYIEGCVGSGKTYAASAIAKAFILSGYSVAMGTTLSMLEEIKRSYDDDRAPGISRYVGSDVLIMDDIGKETTSSWALTNLFQIVNSRYEDMLPTIYTSQYDVDTLLSRMARYGDRETAEAIVSRIVQTSTHVRLPKRDRRRESSFFGEDGTKGTQGNLRHR